MISSQSIWFEIVSVTFDSMDSGISQTRTDGDAGNAEARYRSGSALITSKLLAAMPRAVCYVKMAAEQGHGLCNFVWTSAL